MPSNEVVMDGVHCASLLECKRSGSQYALTVNGHGAHREEECTHNTNIVSKTSDYGLTILENKICNKQSIFKMF